MLLQGNLPPEINGYDKKLSFIRSILPRSCLLYIFEFQLVNLLSPPKVCFSWGTNFMGKIYREVVLHAGTNDHIIPRGKEFHKIHFPVI